METNLILWVQRVMVELLIEPTWDGNLRIDYLYGAAE
jgi:hypothetical protein